MKRIITFIRKDLTLAFRDQIMLYMIIMPLLLSFGFGFFMNSMQDTQVTFVVTQDVEESVIKGLRAYGTVTVVDSVEAVEERVLKVDDAVGITPGADQYNIVLEGNEMTALREIAGMAIDQAVSGRYFAEYEVESLGRKESQAKHFAVVAFILTGSLMAGLLAAFNIIDEKESRATQALGISPFSFTDMLVSRGIMTLILGILLGVGSAFIIMGPTINYGLLILGVVFSTVMSLLIGFGIGGFAQSQIEGIALIKIVFLFYTGVPAAALFMPVKWQWTLYPFPNYWAFEVFKSILAKPITMSHFWWSSLFMVLISGILLLGLTPGMKKRLFLR